jgi:nitric oxide reductase subunit C
MHNRQPANPGPLRVRVYLVLVACFFLQTAFVYFDVPRRGQGQEFTAEAKEGMRLWRQNNCQACHQLYGYGGFLGPDLTNLVSRRPLEDLTTILTVGRKQMPAFHFDEEQREALVAFLREMDQTGTGLPSFTTLREDLQVESLVADYLAASGETAEAAVLRGEQAMTFNGCNLCHVTFGVGTQGAPDMTQALSFRSKDYIRELLPSGKASMPAYEDLTDQEIEDILACLEWMHLHRRELGLFSSKQENGDTFQWNNVPWFEY